MTDAKKATVDAVTLSTKVATDFGSVTTDEANPAEGDKANATR